MFENVIWNLYYGWLKMKLTQISGENLCYIPASEQQKYYLQNIQKHLQGSHNYLHFSKLFVTLVEQQQQSRTMSYATLAIVDVVFLHV